MSCILSTLINLTCKVILPLTLSAPSCIIPSLTGFVLLAYYQPWDVSIHGWVLSEASGWNCPRSLWSSVMETEALFSGKGRGKMVGQEGYLRLQQLLIKQVAFRCTCFRWKHQISPRLFDIKPFQVFIIKCLILCQTTCPEVSTWPSKFPPPALGHEGFVGQASLQPLSSQGAQIVRWAWPFAAQALDWTNFMSSLE